MTHARQQIREQVKTLLTDLTTTKKQVYASRAYPLQAENLPALRIYTNDEAMERINTGKPSAWLRGLDIVIECLAANDKKFDEIIDDMIEEVETALKDQTLGGLVRSLDPAQITIDMSGETQQPFGIARYIWRAIYAS